MTRVSRESLFGCRWAILNDVLVILVGDDLDQNKNWKSTFHRQTLIVGNANVDVGSYRAIA